MDDTFSGAVEDEDAAVDDTFSEAAVLEDGAAVLESGAVELDESGAVDEDEDDTAVEDEIITTSGAGVGEGVRYDCGHLLPIKYAPTNAPTINVATTASFMVRLHLVGAEKTAPIWGGTDVYRVR